MTATCKRWPLLLNPSTCQPVGSLACTLGPSRAGLDGPGEGASPAAVLRGASLKRLTLRLSVML